MELSEAEEFIRELLSLLDQIEIEDDATLASGRFDIIEKYGEVIFSFPISERKN